jgi:hypothetical protein
MAVVPAVQLTIKSARTRTSDAAGRRAILVAGIACSSSKNVLCRCGDERAEKREKYRNCLLIYRRVRGKEAWQLLPEHGEALDGFEEDLEVSVRVFPVFTRRELD